MKIVIDIDEDVYEDAMNDIPNGLCKYSNEALRNGVPLPNVESVEVCHDEIRVTYKRDTKHIFPVTYGRCTENSDGHSVRIPFK